ncbi:MAG: hypothetical protein V3V74_01335 [Nitrosomonadaceae bacterium]
MSAIRDLMSSIGIFTVVIMVVACIFFAIGTLLWPYTINTWLIYSDKPPQVEWWMGGLMGIVPGIGQMCIPAAFITFILMLFLN